MRAHCTGRRALGGLAPSSAPFCLGIGKVETKGTDRFSSGVNPSWWSPKYAAGGSVVLGRALHTPFSAAGRQNHGSLGSLVRQKGARSPVVLHCPVWRVRAGFPSKARAPRYLRSLSHLAFSCSPPAPSSPPHPWPSQIHRGLGWTHHKPQTIMGPSSPFPPSGPFHFFLQICCPGG